MESRTSGSVLKEFEVSLLCKRTAKGTTSLGILLTAVSPWFRVTAFVTSVDEPPLSNLWTVKFFELSCLSRYCCVFHKDIITIIICFLKEKIWYVTIRLSIGALRKKKWNIRVVKVSRNDVVVLICKVHGKPNVLYVELLVFGTYSMVLSRAWATANWALIVQRQASTHTRKDTQRVYKPSICSCKLWGERPRRQEEQA